MCVSVVAAPSSVCGGPGVCGGFGETSPISGQSNPRRESTNVTVKTSEIVSKGQWLLQSAQYKAPAAQGSFPLVRSLNHDQPVRLLSPPVSGIASRMFQPISTFVGPAAGLAFCFGSLEDFGRVLFFTVVVVVAVVAAEAAVARAHSRHGHGRTRARNGFCLFLVQDDTTVSSHLVDGTISGRRGLVGSLATTTTATMAMMIMMAGSGESGLAFFLHFIQSTICSTDRVSCMKPILATLGLLPNRSGKSVEFVHFRTCVRTSRDLYLVSRRVGCGCGRGKVCIKSIY